MALQLYNTLTRRLEEFVPRYEGEVRIYTCGPTVYDYFHLGNARAFMIPDMIRRYLEYKGYRVIQVMNFTDIDDKMMKRAKELGITIQELAHRFIQAFFEDMEALNIKEANYYPRATDHIKEIISLIKTLKEKGYVYEGGGDLFFSVRKLQDYGALSGQDLFALKEGVRILSDPRKQDPLDFVLWKAAQVDEPFWESPFGAGRPGWHSECSVMSRKYLGEDFDIHTGGSDLIFPHHENERAQNLAAYGGRFVKYWLHNGYIHIDGEKMSKSLGNFFTTRELLKDFDGEVLRYFLLSKHYRSPINFTQGELQGAEAGLKRILNGVRALGDEMLRLRQGGGSEELQLRGEVEFLTGKKEAFLDAMDKDFNSAKALGHLQSLVKGANQILSYSLSPRPNHYALVKGYFSTIVQLGQVLGFQFIKGEKGQDLLPKVVDLLLEIREGARQEKDFQGADAIREGLLALGIVVEDRPTGPTWFL